MAADHEITLPADTVLRPFSPVTSEPISGVIEAPLSDIGEEITLRPFSPVISYPMTDIIGSDNGGGGGGSCEDTRPDTGMLYPRG